MITIPHLETDITTACQLSCVACNHAVPMWREHGVWKSDPAQVERDLNHLSTIVHAHAWGALGGEPLLHPELIPILKIARKSRVSDIVEVWTNGLLLPRMSRDFWQSFDTLVLSVYEGKHNDSTLAWINDKCRQTGVQLVIKDERTWHNFRNNLEPVPTTGQATIAKYNGCFFRQFSRVANQGYFYTCCCAPHLPLLVQGRRELGADGVKIDGLTGAGLKAYLNRAEPLGCCDICAGRDTAHAIPWREERDPAKWLAASRGL